MSLKLITEHKDYLLLVEYLKSKDSSIGRWMYNKEEDEVYQTTAKNAWESEKLFPYIIAHLPKHKEAKPLEGVPSLPELPKQEEDVAIQAYCKEFGLDASIKSMYEVAKNSPWVRGYKANTKKYTEKDIRKAHFHGWFQRERYDSQDKCGYEDKFPTNWKDMDYEEREDWFAEQLLQSLSPTLSPIGFKPEYEEYTFEEFIEFPKSDITEKINNEKLKYSGGDETSEQWYYGNIKWITSLIGKKLKIVDEVLQGKYKF